MGSTIRAHTGALADVHEYKIRASLLLKALHSDDGPRALAAADRFRVLAPYASLTPARIVAWREEIRRKHALAVIAAEAGFPSWSELRAKVGAHETGPRANIEGLFADGAVYLNHWCRTYEEAKAIQTADGGYLFPYRRQYVVCPAGKLQAHGIDAFDPDWQRIGRDWVKPLDGRAFHRLNVRLSAILGVLE